MSAASKTDLLSKVLHSNKPYQRKPKDVEQPIKLPAHPLLLFHK